MNLTELLDADWARLQALSGVPASKRRWYHAFSPRFACVSILRCAHAFHAAGLPSLGRLLSITNFVLFGVEVPAKLTIGPGLVLPHPQGTIIGAGYVGRNVTIYQQVTLGAKLADFQFDTAQRPVVEDDVTITAGAKVLGPVRLGRGCIVGANAVVLDDVPPDAVAIGVPARVLEKSNA